MATSTPPALSDLLGPRLAARIADPGATYYGPGAINAPGAWTRVGPVWRLADLTWLVVGPEAIDWGTTRGLAELATASTAKPMWHAAAAALCPTPNVVLCCTAEALATAAMREVRALADAAEQLVAGDGV